MLQLFKDKENNSYLKPVSTQVFIWFWKQKYICEYVMISVMLFTLIAIEWPWGTSSLLYNG